MKDVRKVVVMGAGVMGPGIVQILTIAGVDVCLYNHKKHPEDKISETLEKAKAGMPRMYETFVDEGIITEEQSKKLQQRITYSTDLSEAVKDAQIIFEAVPDRREIKEANYKMLDELLPEDVIIASNTSTLNIFEFVPKNRLQHTLIAHWYSPANVIPLVEVVGNEETDAEDIDTVMSLLEKGGKRPVKMQKFIRGYIINRLQQCLNQEVFYLMDNGYCTPEDIDIAVKSSFIPRACVLGLCKRMDFGGLDMTANNFRNHSYTMPPAVDMPSSLGEHIDNGELGIKTGKGFYDYSDVDIEELKAKRDKQLFKIFRVQNEFMDDPV